MGCCHFYCGNHCGCCGFLCYSMKPRPLPVPAKKKIEIVGTGCLISRQIPYDSSEVKGNTIVLYDGSKKVLSIQCKDGLGCCRLLTSGKAKIGAHGVISIAAFASGGRRYDIGELSSHTDEYLRYNREYAKVQDEVETVPCVEMRPVEKQNLYLTVGVICILLGLGMIFPALSFPGFWALVAIFMIGGFVLLYRSSGTEQVQTTKEIKHYRKDEYRREHWLPSFDRIVEWNRDGSL